MASERVDVTPEVIYASGWPRRYKGIDVHHETPDDGCYICQPDNPRADPEGCSDCDRKAHTPPRPSCASCGHIHAASGCTGPPTPSDLWAGVPVSSCDCDETPAPRAALTTDPSEGESRG